MRDVDAKYLRAMLEALREYEEANEVLRAKWKAFVDAQSTFTGKFATTDHPLGPFVVGDTLVTHTPTNEKWPQDSNQFTYKKVIRCPTSD